MAAVGLVLKHDSKRQYIFLFFGWTCPLRKHFTDPWGWIHPVVCKLNFPNCNMKVINTLMHELIPSINLTYVLFWNEPFCIRSILTFCTESIFWLILNVWIIFSFNRVSCEFHRFESNLPSSFPPSWPVSLLPTSFTVFIQGFLCGDSVWPTLSQLPGISTSMINERLKHIPAYLCVVTCAICQAASVQGSSENDV